VSALLARPLPLTSPRYVCATQVTLLANAAFLTPVPPPRLRRFGIILWELVTRKDPWCELGATDYLMQFRLLNEALEAGRRPALPTGFAAEHEVYAATMLKCWATEPAARPSFEAVVFSLSLVPAAAAASPITPESTAAPPPRPAPRGVYATVDGARSATESASASRGAVYE
jgi:hypothetical protein